MTTHAPFKSVPQISNVVASNKGDDPCSTRLPGAISTNDGRRARASTFACVIPTALGRPVEPEVNIAYARVSGPGSGLGPDPGT